MSTFQLPVFIGDEHGYCHDIAVEYGSAEVAIMIAYFQNYILDNRLQRKELFEGRTWLLATPQEIYEVLYYFSSKEFDDSLDLLLRKGVILKRPCPTDPQGTAHYYAFADEEKFLPKNAAKPFFPQFPEEEEEAMEGDVEGEEYFDLHNFMDEEEEMEEEKVEDFLFQVFAGAAASKILQDLEKTPYLFPFHKSSSKTHNPLRR